MPGEFRAGTENPGGTAGVDERETLSKSKMPWCGSGWSAVLSATRASTENEASSSSGNSGSSA
jgi:hypothetical protein